MDLDPARLRELRQRIQRSREADHAGWERSSRLVARDRLPDTLADLAAAIRAFPLEEDLREALLGCLDRDLLAMDRSAAAERLRTLTGFPVSKAIRALCLTFGLAGAGAPSSAPGLTPGAIEDHLRGQGPPCDLLLADEAPSLIDLGAGDLSFAAELADRYEPELRRSGKRLALHCIERLSPASRWGSLLHADPRRLARLRDATATLDFRFWAGQDMFDLGSLREARARYTIAVCNAPASPTFAYEPTRLSRACIETHLRETKGRFRKTRIDGEEALEVEHRGRALVFPPWKFDIRGPLALLDLMASRAGLCLLAAVDGEVFWELLVQLPANDALRPPDRLLTGEALSEVLGRLYDRLSAIPVGGRVDLSTLTTLRPAMPSVPIGGAPRHRFRYVEVRRGAEFPDIPPSGTARLFKTMTEESPPWLLLLVPETI